MGEFPTYRTTDGKRSRTYVVVRSLVAKFGFLGASSVTILVVAGLVLLVLWAYNTTQLAALAATIASLVVFFPLLIFRKTRHAGAWGLLWSTAILIVGFWALTIAVTLNLFGPYVLAFGLFFFASGVIPISIIGTAWHHDWWHVAEMLLRIAFIMATGLTAKAVLEAD